VVYSVMTKQQQIFIKEYILTRNGTQSAIKAGYSVKNARFQASRLLADANISQRIEEEFKALLAQYKLNEDDVLAGIGQIAKDGTVEANRLRAYELAGKACGLFKEQTVNVTLLNNLDPAKIDKARRLLKARGLQKSPT